MAYENRDNSGSLFKNDDKIEGDSRPNAKGKCRIGGVDYVVATWTKTSQSGGTRFQSLAFEPLPPKPGTDKRAEVREEADEPLPF